MRLLDRYLLRNFLLPFTYCLVGFVAVWLVYELSNNANSFIGGGISLGSVFGFYGANCPPSPCSSCPSRSCSRCSTAWDACRSPTS